MRSTFVSLPARDVARATEFFVGLGFTLNQEASDEQRACITINAATSVMLCAADWFAEFTHAAIADPATASEVSIGIAVETRLEVDELTDKAVAAGAQDASTQDLGYMYMRAFRDLDGHRWAFMHTRVRQLLLDTRHDYVAYV